MCFKSSLIVSRCTDKASVLAKQLLGVNFSLIYGFTEDVFSDGFSAKSLALRDEGEEVTVSSLCRTFRGGFSQQALNRFCAKNLQNQQAQLLVVDGLDGASLDLVRVSALMGVSSLLILNEPSEPLESLDQDSLLWIEEAFKQCSAIVASKEILAMWGALAADTQTFNSLESALENKSLWYQAVEKQSFNYSHYEFCLRDHPLLVRMQQPDVRHFVGCQRVLDLGCGAGIFVDLLKREGINATGVERDPVIAAYGRGLGVDIVTADALTYLESTNDRFDGIYCSHFVEHLPFELVQKLITLLANCLEEGGRLIMTFPDPESIRSQLLGFWRDPEHVRFYHPELVTAVAQSAMLSLEWSSYEEQPHDVTGFPVMPDPITIPPVGMPAESSAQQSLKERILSKLGIMSVAAYQQKESYWQAMATQQREVLTKLQDRTDKLWEVNKTWAWNDNVTLKFRKRTAQN